jgi:hypothetical protein
VGAPVTGWHRMVNVSVKVASFCSTEIVQIESDTVDIFSC